MTYPNLMVKYYKLSYNLSFSIHTFKTYTITQANSIYSTMSSKLWTVYIFWFIITKSTPSFYSRFNKTPLFF